MADESDERKTPGSIEDRKGFHFPERFYRDIWLFMVTGFLLWAALGAKHESDTRQDQICQLLEKQHRNDIQRLRSSYDYIERLPRKELNTSLNRAVIRNLPQLEEQVKLKPPGFCSDKGVGLPGPNPEIPKRPVGLGG